jgi:hypothetical protein
VIFVLAPASAAEEQRQQQQQQLQQRHLVIFELASLASVCAPPQPPALP